MMPVPMPPAQINQTALEFCDMIATPACIAALYNITEGTKAAANNQLGIFEDLGDYYRQTDLNEFFLTLYPRIPQGTHPVLDLIDGAVAPTTNLSDAGPESDLDFQISYPIIWHVNLRKEIRTKSANGSQVRPTFARFPASRCLRCPSSGIPRILWIRCLRDAVLSISPLLPSEEHLAWQLTQSLT